MRYSTGTGMNKLHVRSQTLGKLVLDWKEIKKTFSGTKDEADVNLLKCRGTRIMNLGANLEDCEDQKTKCRTSSFQAFQYLVFSIPGIVLLLNFFYWFVRGSYETHS